MNDFPLPGENALNLDPGQRARPSDTTEGEPCEVLPDPIRIELEIEAVPKVQYVMHANDVPVLRSVRIENQGSDPLREIEVVISAQPQFASDLVLRLDELRAGAARRFEPEWRLDADYLDRLSERVEGSVQVIVRAQGKRIAQEKRSVQILTKNEWPGDGVFPEVLAAFVLPNEGAVSDLLRNAGAVLQKWTGSPTIDGYQRKNPEAVMQQAAAILAALGMEQVQYLSPPASFETEGQRVRLPQQLANSKQGACLDLSLFIAGALEAAGLNPIIVLVEGHAFCGVWLEDRAWQNSTTDDVARLRNDLELHNLVVFDPTCFVAGQHSDFEDASKVAKRHLVDDSKFRVAVDVRRARTGGVHPMSTLQVAPIASANVNTDSVTAVLTAPDASAALASRQRRATPMREVEKGPQRIETWKRKLLDLTLRNRLLNLPSKGKWVRLLVPSVAKLEDALAEEQIFSLLPKPDEIASEDAADSLAPRPKMDEEDLRELLETGQANGVLYADMQAEPLEKRLTALLRDARTAEEEGGANNLYLSVGALKYFETEKSEKARFAPVILVPVTLTRRTASEGIRLSARSEDARINVTLLRYLEETYGVCIEGVDPPPDDGSGLDVPLIFQLFREEIRSKRGWEIVEEARVSMFSFSKILIWRDLEEYTDRLIESPIVRHLVESPNEKYSDGIEFRDPKELDAVARSVETFVPMSADSSQLAAIVAAAEGKSFVLIGPPGTGKSQTITNLITHCLATGKTVLFVSEKMAALEVVYRRLAQVGLSDRCLELHSQKANKKDVLEQLRVSLESTEVTSAPVRDSIASDFDDVRDRLNGYVHALHRMRPSGESVFQTLSRLIGGQDVSKFDLAWPGIDDTPEEKLTTARKAVADAEAAARVAVVGPAHPLTGIGHEEYSPLWEDQTRNALAATVEPLEKFEVTARAVGNLILGETEFPKYEDRAPVLEAVEILLRPKPISRVALMTEDWQGLLVQVRAAIESIENLRSEREYFAMRYARSTSEIDDVGLLGELRLVEAKWAVPRFFARRTWRKKFFAVASPKSQLDLAAAESDLVRLGELRNRAKDLDEVSAKARQVFTDDWAGEQSDLTALEDSLSWAERLRGKARECSILLGSSSEVLTELWTRLLPSEGGISANIRPAFENLEEEWTGAYVRTSAASSLVRPTDPEPWRGPNATECLGLVRRWQDGWTREQARAWCQWRSARHLAVNAGVRVIVEAIETGMLAPGELSAAFERSFGEAWYLHTISKDEALRAFQSQSHVRAIEQFRALDDRLMQATHEAVRHRIETNSRSRASQLSSVQGGFLRREIQKQRRHRPIRTMFKEAGDLIRELRPCVLMSPLSVAQYLDPSLPRFDVVVFDEASQMPVWDAIGAVARGNQLIVVGDPKQLPPTNFFGKTDAGADEDADTEDVESVLDECIASNIEQHTLSWHYRSRHESLIAFSNRNYYEGKLITFPAAVNDGFGVTWVPVPDGVYDFGKSRTNRREAEVLVAELVRRLRDPELSKNTIGVVTLSQAQQALVEDLLDEARRKHPEIEAFFGESVREPVFVKNLENVQGDERDVILFTICYGPDLTKKVRMNFGPLNKEGGWRRLNVAITRARQEILVFSTLTADQIDLNRTKSVGVRDLRRFLEFAERGDAAFAAELETDLTAEHDSPFEQEVCMAIEARGWTVHRQVGCSGYRIDLAIVDPESPGRYLLGVECDGASYHSAPSARDRDKLRQALLESLGWTLHRIWSTDWWENRERELDELAAALDRAQSRIVAPAALHTAGETDESPIAQTPYTSSGPAAIVAPEAQASFFEPISQIPATHASQLPTSASERVELVLQQLEANPDSETFRGRLERYRATECQILGTQADYYEGTTTSRIASILRGVVELEGPILSSLAARRVGEMWGFTRMKSKAVDRVLDQLRSAGLATTDDTEDVVLWSGPQAIDQHLVPRVGQDSRSERSISEIPLVELGSLLRFWVDEAGPMPERELFEHAIRTMRLKKLGALIRTRLELSLASAIKRGELVSTDGVVRLSRQ